MSLQVSSTPASGQEAGPIAVRPPSASRGRFVALPVHLADDPSISPLEKAVLVALIGWAWSRPHCWPSDRSIGLKVGRSVPSVQRALRRLDAAGLIRRERCDASPVGRRIVLLWAVGDDRAPRSGPIDPPRSPLIAESDRRRGPDSEDQTGRSAAPPGRRRPEPSGGPPSASSAPVEARTDRPDAPPAIRPDPPAPPADPPAPRPRSWSWSRADLESHLASDDPILRREAARRLTPPPSTPTPAPILGVEDVLSRIRESPTYPALAAELLAQGLGDRKSWGYLHALCHRAWSGELAPQALAVAWREATGGRARNPGALFVSVVRREARS